MNDIKSFCERMNLKNVKFMVHADGLVFGNCDLNELKDGE